MSELTKYAPDEIRSQVISQCKTVEHLAYVLARLHSDKALLFAQGFAPDILNMIGQETAAYMETLGDILNGMDAVTEEDERFAPIFEEAHQLWPSAGRRQA